LNVLAHVMAAKTSESTSVAAVASACAPFRFTSLLCSQILCPGFIAVPRECTAKANTSTPMLNVVAFQFCASSEMCVVHLSGDCVLLTQISGIGKEEKENILCRVFQLGGQRFGLYVKGPSRHCNPLSCTRIDPRQIIHSGTDQ
jgi:hypothetical protein